MSGKLSLEPLADIVARLRGEGGCPWDREQTFESLKPQLVEEAYEVVEAIEKGDMEALSEELGDVLLHVVFHSRLAEEKGAFSLSTVIEKITRKMKRRHPHVFGQADFKDAEEVLRNWERIKQEEKAAGEGGRDGLPSILEGIPKSLPALMMAHKVQSKVARVGFDWERIEDVVEKLKEEVKEFESAYKAHDPARMEEEMGDLLFSIVNVARFLDIDPELALKNTVEKFIARFKHIEGRAAGSGKDLEGMSLSEMDALWEEAKQKVK